MSYRRTAPETTARHNFVQPSDSAFHFRTYQLDAPDCRHRAQDGFSAQETEGNIYDEPQSFHSCALTCPETGLVTGVLDYVNEDDGIEGWAINVDDVSQTIEISVILDDIEIATVSTGIPRPDVNASLTLDGNPGFRLPWKSAKSFDSAGTSTTSTMRLVAKLTGGLLLERTINTPPHVIRLRSKRAITARTQSTNSDSVRLIAFYLPQYHPIPENDRWWGEGFTEWHNVARGQPAFPEHYQPHIPADLGFYDLRVPEVREKQSHLASEHGIFGFCYYYYWFAGKRLLEMPLNEVLSSGKPDFPFCVCWANETWSRRWDGSENEILIAQEHNEDTDLGFIEDVLPILKDIRYISVDGAALLLVYRVSLFPNAVNTARMWRERCREHNIELHLCAVESFQISDPAQYGFDSAVEFPPHNNPTHGINHTIPGLDDRFEGGIFDYAELVGQDLRRPVPPYKRFKGVMLGWDNTARRGPKANMFVNSSPEAYEAWLNGAIDYTRRNLPSSQQLIFVNAWNEWAEGTHLEPDQKYGRAFLEATARAVYGTSPWTPTRSAMQSSWHDNETIQSIIARADAEIAIRDRTIAYLGRLATDRGDMKSLSVFTRATTEWLGGNFSVVEGFRGNLDRFGRDGFDGSAAVSVEGTLVFISGWFITPGEPCSENTPFWLRACSNTGGGDFIALVPRRTLRKDVSLLFEQLGAAITDWSGFLTYADFGQVPTGEYSLRAVVSQETGSVEVPLPGRIYVA